jgi:sodium/bile acid cotransporter 7
MRFPRLPAVVDNYLIALLATVTLAAVLPCRGAFALALQAFSVFAIAALFFLHGARLPRETAIAGLSHWRLHLLVLSCTFLAFPLFGFVFGQLVPQSWLGPELMLGVLYLCTLPSTVQSSIAFTSIAGGNVAAAVCSASLSNLLGVVLTPLLVSILLSRDGDAAIDLESVGRIVLQLALPFCVGHWSRPWLGRWLERRRSLLASADRGIVLLIVYLAFSATVVEGLWRRVPLATLAVLVLFMGLLLILALLFTRSTSRRLGFPHTDEIAVVFCGSKKSLASGVPIANVLFAGNPALGVILLPVLVYHQIQLMACAVLARRYAQKHDRSR